MTMEFKCKRCGYHTVRWDCVAYHLTRKRKCSPKYSDVDPGILLAEAKLEKDLSKMESMTIEDKECRFCGMEFTFATNKFRHERTCKSKMEDTYSIPTPMPNTSDIIKKIVSFLPNLTSEPKHKTKPEFKTHTHTYDMTSKFTRMLIFDRIDKSILFDGDHPSAFFLQCVCEKRDGLRDLLKNVYFNKKYIKNCVLFISEDDDPNSRVKVFDGSEFFIQPWTDICKILMREWEALWSYTYYKHEDKIKEMVADTPYEYLNVEGFVYNFDLTGNVFYDVVRDNRPFMLSLFLEDPYAHEI